MPNRHARNLFAAAFLLLVPALSHGGFTNASGNVTLLEGQAGIQKAGKGVFVPAKLNDPLSQGDVFKTEAASRAELRLADGSVIRVSANSKVALDQLQTDATTGARKMSLNAMFGRFWAHVVKMKGESSFAMRAGGSIIGVRGTAYDTQVSESGEVQVKVHDGAAVVSDSGGKEFAQVGKDEGAKISKGAATKSTFDEKAEEGDEWVKWNHEKDKVRIMVIIDEKDVEGVTAQMPFSETEVINALKTKYEFYVIDQQQMAKIQKKDEVRAAARGDQKAALSLGEEMYADIIITGAAKSEKQTGLEVLDKSGIKSVKTVIAARTIRVDNGEIISAENFSGKGADVTDSAAAQKALVEAGKAIADYAVDKLIGAWSTVKTKGSRIQVMVENASFSQYKAIAEKLKALGATNVTPNAFANGVGAIDLGYSEGADKLAEKMDGATAGGGTLSVVEASGNRVKLRVK